MERRKETKIKPMRYLGYSLIALGILSLVELGYYSFRKFQEYSRSNEVNLGQSSIRFTNNLEAID